MLKSLRRAFAPEPLARRAGFLTQASARLLERLRRPAYIQKESVTAASTTLRTLTAAALALPGLAQAAPGDMASLQYGHYKQSPWLMYGDLKSQYNPLQVDNIGATGLLTFEDRWKFGFNYVQDTWSGATPVTSAPNALGGNNPTAAGASPLVRGNGTILYDQRLQPWQLNEETAEYVPDSRLVNTIASASPEIRNQGDFRIGHEWDEAAVNLGGGISQEPDYNSAFGSVNGSLDFNRKLTTLNAGLSYTNSDINARINPTFSPYVDKSYYASRGQINLEANPGGLPSEYLTGNRQDWSVHLNLAQVVNKDLLLESGIGFIRSTGFLAILIKPSIWCLSIPRNLPTMSGLTG